MLTHNPGALRTPYPEALRPLLSIRMAEESRAWLSHWAMIAADPTPLHELPAAAARLGIGGLSVKDESWRSPLASFKALGAPIALARLILRLQPQPGMQAAELFAGRWRGSLQDFAVVTASAGNHGRALAAAARSIGCRCVVVLHARVSAEREGAIGDCGAEIVRVAGDYDASVEEAARLAAAHGWQVVSDTSYAGYETVPRDVMQGYGVIAAEIAEQGGGRADAPAFTHVFLQGGVGGLAAGVVSWLWEWHGQQRPRFVVVEPRGADCLYRSALAGRASRASGPVDSLMAGLACGAASPLAWRVLQPGVDDFLLIDDEDARAAMCGLGAGVDGDVPLLAGESGAAGMAGLAKACADARIAAALGLGHDSRVLLINTEGATAPRLYRELTGGAAESVLRRQHAWRGAATAG